MNMTPHWNNSPETVVGAESEVVRYLERVEALLDLLNMTHREMNDYWNLSLEKGGESQGDYEAYRSSAKNYDSLIAVHAAMVERLVRSLSSLNKLVAREGTVSYMLIPPVAQALEEYGHLIPFFDKGGQLPRRPRYE